MAILCWICCFLHHMGLISVKLESLHLGVSLISRFPINHLDLMLHWFDIFSSSCWLNLNKIWRTGISLRFILCNMLSRVCTRHSTRSRKNNGLLIGLIVSKVELRLPSISAGVYADLQQKKVHETTKLNNSFGKSARLF